MDGNIKKSYLHIQKSFEKKVKYKPSVLYRVLSLYLILTLGLYPYIALHRGAVNHLRDDYVASISRDLSIQLIFFELARNLLFT